MILMKRIYVSAQGQEALDFNIDHISHMIYNLIMKTAQEELARLTNIFIKKIYH
jgi:hypothetical protein